MAVHPPDCRTASQVPDVGSAGVRRTLGYRAGPRAARGGGVCVDFIVTRSRCLRRGRTDRCVETLVALGRGRSMDSAPS